MRSIDAHISAVDFVRQVEANLEYDELSAMLHDCIRISRGGNMLDEGYIMHALFCHEHMAALCASYENDFKYR